MTPRGPDHPQTRGWVSTSLPQRERCLHEGCQTGPCPHKHAASGNQAARKPPWAAGAGRGWGAGMGCVHRSRGLREGGLASGRTDGLPCWALTDRPTGVTLPLSRSLWPHRLIWKPSSLGSMCPHLTTSTPSLSICPFPAPGEEEWERLHCCVQQCGRASLLFLARV